MSEIDLILATEKLGIQAKSFLQSDLGKYISGCALQDVEAAKDDLILLDPYGFTSLAELQNKISSLQQRARIAESLTQYLAEAITNGEQATHKLENEETE